MGGTRFLRASRDHEKHGSNLPFFSRARQGGGVLIIMHGRSRMTIGPRPSTMPGRSTLGFYRPGKYFLPQARSTVRCWASRMKGELHPTKNVFPRRIFLRKDDSVNELTHFLVWPLPETATGVLSNCLVGALPYAQYVIRSSPLCRVKVLPAQRCFISTASRDDRPQKQKNGTLVTYSSSRSERRVL